MNRHLENNRTLWDQLATLHANSPAYDLAGFKNEQRAGLTTLEIQEVGPVQNKRLLHLQCHLGLGTLEWAKRGAQVTGVDFSAEAIATARSLSETLALPAKFICSDIYALPDVLQTSFDLVFSSFGVLSWLPDLRTWAEIVAQFLKPNGVFYLAEFHPILRVFNEEAANLVDLRPVHAYFHAAEPTSWAVTGSHLAPEVQLKNVTSHEWRHSLSDVIVSLIEAGLQIEFLHEFPFCVEQFLPCMQRGADGWWRLPSEEETLPLMFSIKARKSSGQIP